MKYLITGGTGFIGRFLIENLCLRPNAEIYVITRENSKHKFDALLTKLHVNDRNKVHMLTGDINYENLSLDQKWIDDNINQIDNFYHLAAIYDLNANEESQTLVNIEGTANVVNLANKLN